MADTIYDIVYKRFMFAASVLGRPWGRDTST